MPVADITVTVTDELPLPGRGSIVYGTLAIDASADTYAAGGLVLDATNFRGKTVLSPEVKPKILLARGIAGYVYEYDRTGGKLLVRAQTNAAAEDAPLGELADAAIPAGVSGDTVNFFALFDKFPAA